MLYEHAGTTFALYADSESNNAQRYRRANDRIMPPVDHSVWQ